MPTEPTSPLSTPFRNIALAFSGGGFRAASFSLGNLSYLQHIKLPLDDTRESSVTSLLDNVTFISSASGGTITASVYGMLRIKGISFGRIYKTLLAALDGDMVLNNALDKLNDDNEWTLSSNTKTRNLINSFAKAYDELLFQHETFSIFWDKKPEDSFEVCFNTTEFRRGVSFRFQTDGNEQTREKIGNRFIYFDDKQINLIKKIKLGDILAASSCFPSGFEPIVFPDDFAHKTLESSALRQTLIVEQYDTKTGQLQPNEAIEFMDGGITDNQGLQSAMRADQRRRKNKQKEFDLILFSDVASYFMQPYEVPGQKKNSAWRQNTLLDIFNGVKKKLSLIPKLLITFSITFLISLSLILLTSPLYLHSIGYFLSGISLCALSALLMVNRFKNKSGISTFLHTSFDIKQYLKKAIPSIRHFSDEIIDKLIYFFKRTKLGVLEQMAEARLSSVLTMVSDINLKQVRRLIYEEFYSNSIWENRRCPNFIYELSKQNIESRKRTLTECMRDKKLTEEDVKLLTPSSKIVDVAEQARMVGTTLWFNKGNTKELRAVVACGQFSTCVSLLHYVLEITNDSTIKLSESVKKMIEEIKKKLIVDWKAFNDNPLFLYQFYEK